MEGVSGLEVIHDEGDVGIQATVVIGLGAPAISRELKLEARVVIHQKGVGP